MITNLTLSPVTESRWRFATWLEASSAIMLCDLSLSLGHVQKPCLGSKVDEQIVPAASGYSRSRVGLHPIF